MRRLLILASGGQGGPVVSRGRNLVAPAYLFACLLLGGSGQGIWQNMVLQLAGIAIIAWAAATGSPDSSPRAARQLLGLAILGIAVVGLQLVPLPLGLWSHLGPRHDLATGLQSLGRSIPAEPLSLSAANGLNSLLGLIPALAIVCAMSRLRAYRARLARLRAFGGNLGRGGAGRVASRHVGLGLVALVPV